MFPALLLFILITLVMVMVSGLLSLRHSLCDPRLNKFVIEILIKLILFQVLLVGAAAGADSDTNDKLGDLDMLDMKNATITLLNLMKLRDARVLNFLSAV